MVGPSMGVGSEGSTAGAANTAASRAGAAAGVSSAAAGAARLSAAGAAAAVSNGFWLSAMTYYVPCMLPRPITEHERLEIN